MKTVCRICRDASVHGVGIVTSRASAIAALKAAVSFGESRDVRHATVALGAVLRPRRVGQRFAAAFRFAAMLLRASGRKPERVLGDDYRRMGVIR